MSSSNNDEGRNNAGNDHRWVSDSVECVNGPGPVDDSRGGNTVGKVETSLRGALWVSQGCRPHGWRGPSALCQVGEDRFRTPVVCPPAGL